MSFASDRMQPLSLPQLMRWIRLERNRHGSIFGVPMSAMFSTGSNSPLLPLGPAAGPHTQLTQNIIAAYLCGGRFFELKTVQKLDRLEIAKPCIDAVDECYNSEWSTELTLEQAWEEYAKAWLLLPLVRELLQPEGDTTPDYLFNISVGYDLVGIRSAAVDHFIESMRNASANQRFEQLREIMLRESSPFAGELDLDRERLEQLIMDCDSRITDSVTLSTMHGCPPEEIEAIGRYLLEEKGLHTTIKLNPTLLGEAKVKQLLSIAGYDYLQLDPQTFSADLAWEQAESLIESLSRTAGEQQLQLGVKLSNTLPVQNRRGLLAGEEVYLSGRALYPLTLNLAAKLATATEGALPISFSGGANALNLAPLLKCGIKPVTLATDLLKPGGYQRLGRMAQQAAQLLEEGLPEQIDLEAVTRLAEAAADSRYSGKALHEESQTGFDSSLPLFDCRITPCREACPVHQDVPGYLRLLGQNRFSDALTLIQEHNPLPHITGYICDHQCMAACSRHHYEESVHIRDAKRLAAETATADNVAQLKATTPATDARIAIVGAGPAGLATASFLRRAAVPVTLFDQRESAGGVVQHVIPAFRLPETALQQDLQFLEALGVEFSYGFTADFNLDDLMAAGFTHAVLAVGATRSKQLSLECDTTPRFDAVDFLISCRQDDPPASVRGDVVVIGGGNTAMDSARAAIRLPGIKSVTIVYRRTSRQMPADREEYHAARKDGVKWLELLSPTGLQQGELNCQRMRLLDQEGETRQRVEAIAGEEVKIRCDTLISAIGEMVDEQLLQRNDITLTDAGTIAVDAETLLTSRQQVYAVGDARRGPATVVEAIADGRRAANAILAELDLEPAPYPVPHTAALPDPIPMLQERQGELRTATELPLTAASCAAETERCLACDLLCNRCVTVCPNRANVALDLKQEDLFRDRFQILHLEALCNECGNCVTFCPHDGSPWHEKPVLFSSETAFSASKACGILPSDKETGGNRRYRVRLEQFTTEIELQPDGTYAGATELTDSNAGQQLLRLLKLLHTDYDYLLL